MAVARKPAPVKAEPAQPAPALALPQVDIARAIETAAAPAREIQTSVREAAEKGVEETRAAFARVKAATEEASGSLEASVKLVAEGTLAFNHKLVDAVRANTEAQFDLVKALLGVRSWSEAIALNSEHARKQFDALNAQGKDLAAFAQKVTQDSFAPLKDSFSKAFQAR